MNSSDAIPSGAMRLQKFLSDAGVASRRHAEQLILDGLVSVNGATVMQLPAFVDPQQDDVRVEGRRVRAQELAYFVANKPAGFVCTNDDPSGRRLAAELLPPMKERLFVVSRLDVESTGLLLFSNDGELAQRITHPRFGIEKVYRVTVRGRVPDDIAGRLRAGVYFAEGRARASDAQIIHRERDSSALEITLTEGRNRQVQRMLAKLGFPVRQLKRIKIGPLSLKGIPVGASRPLSPRELSELKAALPDAAQQAPRPKNAGDKPRKRSAPRRKVAPPAPARSAPADRSDERKRRLIT